MNFNLLKEMKVRILKFRSQRKFHTKNCWKNDRSGRTEKHFAIKIRPIVKVFVVGMGYCKRFYCKYGLLYTLLLKILVIVNAFVVDYSKSFC